MSGRIKRYSKEVGIFPALIVDVFEYSVVWGDVLKGVGRSWVFIGIVARELRTRYSDEIGRTSSEFDDEG